MSKEEKYDKIQQVADKFLLYQKMSSGRERPFAFEAAFKQMMEVITGGREWEACLKRRRQRMDAM